MKSKGRNRRQKISDWWHDEITAQLTGMQKAWIWLMDDGCKNLYRWGVLVMLIAAWITVFLLSIGMQS